MGSITRGTKAGTGTTDFGSTTALSSEVNTDFNTIVNVINGSLDANNLAANAVTTTKITDLNVTTGKIADLGVTTGKINDLAVTTAKIAALNVTTAKIAVGGSVNTHQTAVVTGGMDWSTVETDIVTLPSITTRGGPVFLVSSAMVLAVTSALGSFTGVVTLQWYRAGVSVHTVSYTMTLNNVSAIPVPVPQFVDTPGAGSYVYKMTGKTDTTSIHLETGTLGSSGASFVYELA